MTPRPHFTRKERPSSAIFIGSLGSNSTANVATPPDLPKLPEPSESSPGSSSGLPSPPSTNSTGSGGVDDEGTNTNSLRQRSTSRLPLPSTMYNGTYKIKDSDVSSTSTLMDGEDEYNENENDEDNTARFNSSRRLSTSRTTFVENTSALQRVKSLTERNRMVLDKLTSITRGSPVPGSSKTLLRDPFSTTNASSPSYSATPRSRPQSTTKLRSPFPMPIDDRTDPGHSGSETERESTRGYAHAHSYSSSDSMSNTPTSTYAQPDFVRPRQRSAPSSPVKSPRKSRHSSPGPLRTPRKRASLAASVSDARRGGSSGEDETEDVTKAALAAVASTRRSPGSISRRNLGRQPLPREFGPRDSRSVLGERQSEPATPQRERFYSTRSPSPPKSPSRANSALPATSQSMQQPLRRPTTQRVSTVRELTRRHQTRWLSEDLSASSVDGDVESETPSRSIMTNSLTGRKQRLRSGSSESPLTGRSLPGEGLRSTGLTKKPEVTPREERSRDVFDDASDVEVSSSGVTSLKRALSIGSRSAVNGQSDWDSPSPVTTSGKMGIGDTRTPALAMRTLETRTSDTRTANGSYVTPARSVTSMAALHSDTISSSDPRPLRSYRHSLDLDSSATAAAAQDFGQLGSTSRHADRAYTSLSNHSRRTAQGEGQAEHQRLLLDALGTFESQLSRLPPMGQTTTTTIPEVFQNSQQIVGDLDRLNTLLRQSVHSAMEAEVHAELADMNGSEAHLAKLWLNIGKEHREHLRLTEGLVRTLTQFFLGVGKVLRETPTPSTQNHTRAISLDEQAARRSAHDGSNSVTSSEKRSADGRLSRETRRSWELRSYTETRAASRLASLERTTTSRPPSATQTLARSSATSSSGGRSAADAAREQIQTPATMRSAASKHLPARRYSPKEARSASDPAAVGFMPSLDSQETLRAHDPSPAPSSRRGTLSYGERSRALPPLSIPPALSTLPSESLLQQSSSFDRSERRKVSTSSIMTIRAEPSLPPVIKPPNTTTALTTAPVSIESPVSFGSALSRTDSSSSSHTNGVTFSRPSPDSMSTLRQQTDSKGLRQRTQPSSAVDPSPISRLRSPISGSDTERPRSNTFRARTSLDRLVTGEDGGVSSRASTLTSRRERRRTVTAASEIFSSRNGR